MGTRTRMDKNGQWAVLALLLLLALPLHATNDFSDANCVAVWRLEDGALTTDSKGTNTLTNSGVTAETTDFQEGAACADFEDTDPDVMSIADADLDADFPLKNGDANKKISVCLWVKFETLPEALVEDHVFITGKYDKANNKRSIMIAARSPASTNSDYMAILLGYNGGASFEPLITDLVLATGIWYHVGATFNDADKSWRIRIYRASDQTVHDYSGTATNNINVEDAPWIIGNTADLEADPYFDGLLDEMVVFDDILTTGEIDEIRSGTYGSDTDLIRQWWWRRRRQ